MGMGNLDLYNAVREVPMKAQRTIQAGRLKGMTDINPMWRIKKLTEQFGPCGVGWKSEIIRTWLEHGANGEICAFVEIKLYIIFEGEWSDGIPGLGGSKMVSKESNGLYTDDECYKKAYTDALSVACKALGFGADVYFEKDSSKYNENDRSGTESQNSKAERISDKTGVRNKTKSKYAEVVEIIKGINLTLDNVTEWIAEKFGKEIKINDLTDEQFGLLMSSLRKYVIEAESK